MKTFYSIRVTLHMMCLSGSQTALELEHYYQSCKTGDMCAPQTSSTYLTWTFPWLRYCKRGYFRWGKFSRKCLQDISRGGNFHNSPPISFIKAYGFYFRVGGKFHEEDKSAKITPMGKFPRLQYQTSVCYTVHASRMTCINFRLFMPF